MSLTQKHVFSKKSVGSQNDADFKFVEGKFGVNFKIFCFYIIFRDFLHITFLKTILKKKPLERIRNQDQILRFLHS